eukprot:473058-Hanusia_phi.AAC.4
MLVEFRCNRLLGQKFPAFRRKAVKPEDKIVRKLFNGAQEPSEQYDFPSPATCVALPCLAGHWCHSDNRRCCFKHLGHSSSISPRFWGSADHLSRPPLPSPPLFSPPPLRYLLPAWSLISTPPLSNTIISTPPAPPLLRLLRSAGSPCRHRRSSWLLTAPMRACNTCFYAVWLIATASVVVSLVILGRNFCGLAGPSESDLLPPILLNDTSVSVNRLTEDIIRLIKPEEVDAVSVNPNRSSSALLASALFWTRKRERKIREQLYKAFSEMQRLRRRMQANQPPSLNETVRNASALAGNASNTRRESNLTCAESEWIPLISNTPSFEQGMRLDGIKQVHNISDKFKAKICYDKGRMSGKILMEKRFDCNEGIEFSKDPQYSREVRSRRGPDEFSFNLQGPELHSLVYDMRHLGRCKYEMPFKVTTPGRYFLNLVWWRENYNGATELSSSWLPAHYDLPLGMDVFITLGETGDDAKSTSEILWKHRNASNLPLCDMHDRNYTYMDGRWLYMYNDVQNIFYSPGPKHVRRISANANMYTWVNLENYYWYPNHCKLRHFDPEQARKCITSKVIRMQGDSHIRTIANALTDLACNVWSRGFESGCGSDCKSVDLSRTCYRKDGLGHAQDFFADNGASLNVINLGQHFCDGERKMKFSQYKASIDAGLAKISKLSPSARKTFIWHETNAVMFRKDSWIVGYGDQRTNIRLALYNRYATAKMKELGITVLPTFAGTLPLAQNPDEAHYPLKYLQHSSVQYLLNFFCRQ